MLRKKSSHCALAALLPSLLLCGCMQQSFVPTFAPTDPNTGQGTVQGIAHGGLQAITGATVQLYAVGTTGDGSGTGGNASNNHNSYAAGSFNITGDYTCPSATTLVYITVTGGNPG